MATTATVTNRLHEALGDATGLLESILEAFSKGTGGAYMSDVAEAIDNARAALALPLRNCDLDEVAENPEAAWLDDEDNWDEWGSPKLSIDKWLLAPAKKERRRR